jgi:hypothetical protein
LYTAATIRGKDAASARVYPAEAAMRYRKYLKNKAHYRLIKHSPTQGAQACGALENAFGTQ